MAEVHWTQRRDLLSLLARDQVEQRTGGQVSLSLSLPVMCFVTHPVAQRWLPFQWPSGGPVDTILLARVAHASRERVEVLLHGRGALPRG